MDGGMIISALVSIFLVFLAEYLVGWREKKYHIKELKLNCLQGHLNWMNKIYLDIYLFSRNVDDCLNKSDLNERKRRRFEVDKQYNALIEEVIIYTTSHCYIDDSISIDLDLKGLRESLGKELKNYYDLICDYFKLSNTIEALEKNNEYRKSIDAIFESRFSMINKHIKELLK